MVKAQQSDIRTLPQRHEYWEEREGEEGFRGLVPCNLIFWGIIQHTGNQLTQLPFGILIFSGKRFKGGGGEVDGVQSVFP